MSWKIDKSPILLVSCSLLGYAEPAHVHHTNTHAPLGFRTICIGQRLVRTPQVVHTMLPLIFTSGTQTTPRANRGGLL